MEFAWSERGEDGEYCHLGLCFQTVDYSRVSFFVMWPIDSDVQVKTSPTSKNITTDGDIGFPFVLFDWEQFHEDI